jgi:DNA polymerase III epsilon subunit family exonuclease
MSKETNSSQIFINNETSNIFRHLYRIPPRAGRYIVLDTETTGLNLNDHVVELGAHEVINGRLTGCQFHIYIRPRIKMSEEVINIHGITNEFYDDFYKDIYSNDKQNLINFIKWVGNSLIFAHNASFDMSAINVELKNWGINELPAKRFRCSMKMFKDVVGRIEHNYYDKYVCLEKCCEYFGLKANNNCYHNALFDAFMTARLVCKLYELIENDSRFKNFKKEIKYNPNSYKNFNYLNNNLINNKNKSKYIYLNNTKKFLNKKTQRDKNEEISYEKVLNEEKINRNKIINENINNHVHNEFFRNTDSTTSNESIDKNKSEENLKSTSEKEGFSEEIIDEIFSDL